MVSENVFPKIDGDVFYASEANSIYYNALSLGSILYDSVSVGSDSTTIRASDSSRRKIIIRNIGTYSLFIGSSGVSDTDGYKVLPNQSIIVYSTDTIYGAADSAIGSGTIDVRYLEVQI